MGKLDVLIARARKKLKESRAWISKDYFKVSLNILSIQKNMLACLQVVNFGTVDTYMDMCS